MNRIANVVILAALACFGWKALVEQLPWPSDPIVGFGMLGIVALAVVIAADSL